MAAGRRVFNLVDGDVHVWSARIDDHTGRLPSLENFLSDDERERASRFHFQCDRDRYIITRGLLREMLAAYTGREAPAITFSYRPRGKPELHGGRTLEPLLFNVSHSRRELVFAFSRSFDVGVDVETVEGGTVPDTLAAHCMSPQELTSWNSMSEPARMAAFYKTWVRKEAYLKGLGIGLAVDPSTFSVSLAPRQTLCGRRNSLGQRTGSWRLIELHVGAGVAAAIAVEGASSDMHLQNHRWDPKERLFL